MTGHDGFKFFIREALRKEQGFKCYYCERNFGKTKLTHCTIDHVQPVSRGGKDDWENMVAACYRCNVMKGNLNYEEFADFCRSLTEDKVKSIDKKILKGKWNGYRLIERTP